MGANFLAEFPDLESAGVWIVACRPALPGLESWERILSLLTFCKASDVHFGRFPDVRGASGRAGRGPTGGDGSLAAGLCRAARAGAARLARQTPGQTLTATALVHEVYLRIAGDSNVTWEGRQHFFFAAARAMRDIVVEQARRKAGPKQGGGRQRFELDEACAVVEGPSDDVLAVNEALQELERATRSRPRSSSCATSPA